MEGSVIGWESGLLSGFTKRKGEYEAEQLRAAELANAREADFYKLLLEHGTPEFQSMAATGLLSSAQAPQRKGGLRGWLGEMEANPMTGKIRELIGTPVQTEEPTMGLPSKQYTGYLTGQPSGDAPLAQSATAATEVGAPPLATVNAAPQAGGQWTEQPAPVTGSRTVTKPRQVLLSPDEVAGASTLAQGRARTAAELERAHAIGFSDEEYKKLEQEKARRSVGGVAGQSYAEGNIIADPESPTGYSQELYLRADPSKKMRIPAQPPYTTEEAIKRAGGVATARGAAGAAVPLNTQQRFQATTDLSKQWTVERAAGREMERQFTLMQTGVTRYEADPIGASQAVLVTFQKILDPSSVVRESEYARSPQGLALMDRLQGMVERYSAGGAGVPKPVLEGMVETARQLLDGVKGASDTVRQRIQDTATSYEIDPRLVLGADMPAAAVGAPPPGAAPAGGGSGLDATAPGVFLDSQGNIIRR